MFRCPGLITAQLLRRNGNHQVAWRDSVGLGSAAACGVADRATKLGSALTYLEYIGVLTPVAMGSCLLIWGSRRTTAPRSPDEDCNP